ADETDKPAAETEASNEPEADDKPPPDAPEDKDGGDAAPAPRTFTEGSDEFNTEVDRLAQSKNDKQLAPLSEENKTLKTKVAELERAATHRSEDSGLDRLEEAEGTQHGDTPEVQDIQTTRRQVITMGRENETEKARLDTLAAQLEDAEKDHQAWQKVLPLLLPEDPAQIANVNVLVAKLKSATNDAHMDSIWEGIERELKGMKAAEITSKARARKPGQPDGSGTSVDAANTRSQLKGADAVRQGVKDLENKK
ncbi:hypothetical protein LCGC14_1660840, partial [marine sediment metagenome]